MMTEPRDTERELIEAIQRKHADDSEPMSDYERLVGVMIAFIIGGGVVYGLFRGVFALF